MAKIRIDDGHGWGYNKGKLFFEGDQNWIFSRKYLGPALENEGHSVSFTRGPNALKEEELFAKKRGLYGVNNQIYPLSKRGELGKGNDLLISNHSNAGGGRGTNVWDDTGTPNTPLAVAICKACADGFGLKNGGVHYRRRRDGRNYYQVLLSNQAASGILLERGFHDDLEDSKVLISSSKQEAAAKAIAMAISNFYGKGISILGRPSATIEQMRAYGRKNKAARFFIELVELFYDISVSYEVDPAVAYAQAGKETAFGRYGGVLDKSFRNPGALKTKGGGKNDDPLAHERFSSWQRGIRAQVQHLALYAGAYIPKEKIVDPRHFDLLRGTAKTAVELSGKWAGPGYGEDLEKRIKEIQKICGS